MLRGSTAEAASYQEFKILKSCQNSSLLMDVAEKDLKAKQGSKDSSTKKTSKIQRQTNQKQFQPCY